MCQGALKGEEVYCPGDQGASGILVVSSWPSISWSKFRVETLAGKFMKAAGGCQIMHLHYDKQLEFKEDLLRQALKKFAPVATKLEIRPDYRVCGAILCYRAEAAVSDSEI